MELTASTRATADRCRPARSPASPGYRRRSPSRSSPSASCSPASSSSLSSPPPTRQPTPSPVPSSATCATCAKASPRNAEGSNTVHAAHADCGVGRPGNRGCVSGPAATTGRRRGRSYSASFSRALRWACAVRISRSRPALWSGALYPSGGTAAAALPHPPVRQPSQPRGAAARHRRERRCRGGGFGVRVRAGRRRRRNPAPPAASGGPVPGCLPR